MSASFSKHSRHSSRPRHAVRLQRQLNAIMQAFGDSAYSKRLMAAVVGLLALGGGGAFAVASLAGGDEADATQVQQRMIDQEISSLASGKSLASLVAAPDFVLHRSDRLRTGDSAETLLQRLGVADPAASAYLRRNQVAIQNLWGRSNRDITIEATADHQLLRLYARWVSDDSGNFNRFVVERTADGKDFVAKLDTAELTKSTRLASGVVQSSLFGATDAANVPDNVAVQLAEIFSAQVNFHKNLRKGDTFTVVYETLEADGEPLRAGKVLSAEFVNNGKPYQALWFQEDENKPGAYYDLDGSNLRRAFLASPLEFSRVSSNFGKRFHPIRKEWRNHNGTDYAAVTGTPIRTVGEGVVEFAGWHNGYGNVAYIDHGEQRVTVYAHMSRLDVKTGQRVEQGQVIGAVGSTGMSTGPHLHFEFRVNGEFKDPQIIAQDSAAASPVTKATRERFNKLAEATRMKFQVAPLMMQANAE